MSLSTVLSTVSQSDSLTVPANGAKLGLAGGPARAFSLQVSGVGGTPTAWNVVLEGSLDGTTFTSIATHVSGSQANGVTVTALVNGPWLYARTRLASVTLTPATSITTIFAVSA